MLSLFLALVFLPLRARAILANREKRLLAAPHGGFSPLLFLVFRHLIPASAPPERCEGLNGAFTVLIIEKGN